MPDSPKQPEGAYPPVHPSAHPPQQGPGLLASLRQVPIVSLWLLLSLLAFPLSLQVTGDLPVFAPEILTAMFMLDAIPAPGATGEHLLRLLYDGQVWRLVSPVFLHFGFLHIAFNSVLFFILGVGLEKRLGGWLLLVCLLVWAGVSNVAQLLHSGSPFFGGLSGVVTAMFGARLVLSYLRPADPLMYLPRPLVISVFVSLFLFSTGVAALMDVNIANTAHWSGLAIGIVTGALLDLVLPPVRRLEQPPGRQL